MMAELKPLASLSPSLLARKGAARPAMRPQTYLAFPAGSQLQNDPNDDLGWNDLGHDLNDDQQHESVSTLSGAPLEQTATVDTPDVHLQQLRLTEELLPKPNPAPNRRAPVASPSLQRQAKAAFTLRIDAERHLKLRLLSAITHRSAQNILSTALDALLVTHADLITMPIKPSPEG